MLFLFLFRIVSSDVLSVISFSLRMLCWKQTSNVYPSLIQQNPNRLSVLTIFHSISTFFVSVCVYWVKCKKMDGINIRQIPFIYIYYKFQTHEIHFRKKLLLSCRVALHWIDETEWNEKNKLTNKKCNTTNEMNKGENKSLAVFYAMQCTIFSVYFRQNITKYHLKA